MGAITIIFVPILLGILYVGNLILVTNLDGILSRICHNKHKKPLIILQVTLIVLSLAHVILQLLDMPVIFRYTLDVVLGLMFPILVANIIIFSVMHKKEPEKLRIHNIIFAPIGVLMVGWIVVFVFSMLGGVFQDELEYFNYYHGKKITVLDYTIDDGTNSKKVYKRLKKRLEEDDSDINEKDKLSSNYAIINVCLDNHSNYSSKRYDMLKLLIEHGADVNMQNAEGDTPLLRLHYYSSYIDGKNTDVDGWLACAKLLLDNGADPFLQDDRGYDIFDYVNENLEYYVPRATEEELQETELEAMTKLKELLIEYGYEEEFK